MTTERCERCRFWTRRSDEQGSRGGGYCRRFPPFAPAAWSLTRDEMVPTDQFLNDAWPMVGAQSWCGEFQATNTESPQQ